MKTHSRISVSPWFDDIKSGRMKFDIRRESDARGFWVGDTLELTHNITKEVILCNIVYLYDGPGLWRNHVIIGIEVIKNDSKKENPEKSANITRPDKKTINASLSGNVVASQQATFQSDRPDFDS